VQRLSPDGSLLLFDESGQGAGAGGHSIRSAHFIGGGNPAGEGSAQDFSPDYEFCVAGGFDDRSHLRLVPTKGGMARELPGAGLKYQWARFFPTGDRLLVLASPIQRKSRARVQDVSTGKLCRSALPFMVLMPRSSPDGQYVAARPTWGELTIFPWASRIARVIAVKQPLAPLRWSLDGRVDSTSRICRSQGVYPKCL